MIDFVVHCPQTTYKSQSHTNKTMTDTYNLHTETKPHL